MQRVADDTLAHHCRALCITAFWPIRLPQWVITRMASDRPYVSFHQQRTYPCIGSRPSRATSRREQVQQHQRVEGRLLDHVVGQREQGRWDRYAKRPGGLEVDDEFEFDRALDRQIGRLGALEDSRNIWSHPVVHIGQVRAIG